MATRYIYFRTLGSVLRRLLVIIGIGSAINACTPTVLTPANALAQLETAVSFQAAPCRFPVPEEQTVQCGDLLVPENYSDLNGRQIHLHVAIIKSISDNPAPDPLFIIYGGPGAYALDRLEKTAERFAGVLATRDLILFDQRGVGYSRPSLNCPELDDFELTVVDEQLNREQEFASRLAIYEACRERLEADGINFQAYSAAAIAADTASLRLALAYDEWNLYGVSYGARMVLMIMRDYPEGLRSVVLDSVYPLDIDLAAETAVTHRHALSILYDAAETEHPAFEQDLYALVDDLNANPIAVPVPDPRGQDYYFMKSFDGADLLRLTIDLAHWPQAIPHVPNLVEDIANGKVHDLSHLLRPAAGDQLFSEGLNLSVNCQEMDPALQHPRQNITVPIDQHIYNVAREEMQQCVALCKQWLGDEWSPSRQAPASSEIPTLILTGEQDAIVPQAWSTQAAAGLTKATVESFPSSGHGVMTSDPRAQQLVAAFLLDP